MTEKIQCTTLVLGENGNYYDLGKGEFPSKKEMTINAFTCTREEANRLRGKRPIKNVLFRKKNMGL